VVCPVAEIESSEDVDDAERRGAVWKTSMVPRVSMISMVPWVSTLLDWVLDEMDGCCRPLFFVAQGL